MASPNNGHRGIHGLRVSSDLSCFRISVRPTRKRLARKFTPIPEQPISRLVGHRDSRDTVLDPSFGGGSVLIRL